MHTLKNIAYVFSADEINDIHHRGRSKTFNNSFNNWDSNCMWTTRIVNGWHLIWKTGNVLLVAAFMISGKLSEIQARWNKTRASWPMYFQIKDKIYSITTDPSRFYPKLSKLWQPFTQRIITHKDVKVLSSNHFTTDWQLLHRLAEYPIWLSGR